MTCCTAYKVFCEIKKSCEFDRFLNLSSQRDTFVATVLQGLDNDRGPLCVSNHDLSSIWHKIIVIFFNCLVRNLLRSKIYHSNTVNTSRKVHKLRSTRK